MVEDETTTDHRHNDDTVRVLFRASCADRMVRQDPSVLQLGDAGRHLADEEELCLEKGGEGCIACFAAFVGSRR